MAAIYKLYGLVPFGVPLIRATVVTATIRSADRPTSP